MSRLSSAAPEPVTPAPETPAEVPEPPVLEEETPKPKPLLKKGATRIERNMLGKGHHEAQEDHGV
jgi:hypothetical protein